MTPWNAENLVQLRPLGAALWTTYQYGTYWYDVTAPGVDAGSTPIACGEAIAFSRKGLPDQEDMLVLPTWYFYPPNN